MTKSNHSSDSVMFNSEKLCLQWNNFKENISASFADLRGDKEFTDVTLACEDGQQIDAHKVILASSSPFFSELLRKNRHPHPLIYMRSLRSEVLIAIVDFLYFGEAKISQENLNPFLALAEELQLNGLTTETNENDTDCPIKTSPQEVPLIRKKSQKVENTTFGSEHHAQSPADADETVAAIDAKTLIDANMDDLDVQIRSMITKSQSSIPGKGLLSTCNVCGKEGPYMSMPRHVESKHITGVSHTCNICGNISRSNDGLRQHKMKRHKDNSFLAGPEMA